MTEADHSKTVQNTWQRPLPPPVELPDSVDVAVIGGGIVGASTAYYLARGGVRVMLCEKGHIAGEQSGRNWGWVRKQGRDARELPLMIDSMRRWHELGDELGEDLGFTTGGCLFAARTDKELAAHEAWLNVARNHDLDTQLLSASEIGKLVSGAEVAWRGGLYTASDGRAEPHKAAAAIARGAASHGAIISTACAVRGLDIEAGRVAGVVTERGRVRAPQVLCAAGAWTSVFCRSLDIPLPQLKVRGTVVRTARAPELLNGNVFDARIGIRRRQDGGYTVAHGSILDHFITPQSFRWLPKFWPAVREEIGILRLSFGKPFFDELRAPKRWALDTESPFEKTRVLDPAPCARTLRRIRQDLGAVFPALRDVHFEETWAGMIESTPDVIPVIDAVARLPGFYVATGFSGHGFGIGPGAGRAAARMLTGEPGGPDIASLRYSRFFDGSEIRLQASI